MANPTGDCRNFRTWWYTGGAHIRNRILAALVPQSPVPNCCRREGFHLSLSTRTSLTDEDIFPSPTQEEKNNKDCREISTSEYTPSKLQKRNPSRHASLHIRAQRALGLGFLARGWIGVVFVLSLLCSSKHGISLCARGQQGRKCRGGNRGTESPETSFSKAQRCMRGRTCSCLSCCRLQCL